MKTVKIMMSIILSVTIFFSEAPASVLAEESMNIQETEERSEDIPEENPEIIIQNSSEKYTNTDEENENSDELADNTEEPDVLEEDTEELDVLENDTEELDVLVEDTDEQEDDSEELLLDGFEVMSLYDDGSVADQESVALADDSLALSIAYPSDIKCGVPITFTMNATGGTGNYKYRIAALMDSELVSVYDISYGSNGSYGDSNQFTFTFYASGTYYIRFSVMDMTTYQTKTTGLYEYPIVIQDASYPSVEQIVTDIAAQCEAVCSTDFEKALWLHDWIIDHADYDNSYSYCSAEGVLARGAGTCESYHRAYVKLLNKVGIETGRIEGNGHVWTAVKMDGEWYQIDSTWDDMGASYKGTYYEHMYFGLTDYIIGLVHDDHKAAVPGYESTALENNYFIKTGQITQWSDLFVDTIKQNLAAGKTEFTLPVTSSMPDSYKNVIYNLVAYQLSKQKWDDKELSVSYANGQLTCKVIKAGIEISANGNSTETTYTLTAKNVVSPGGVKIVRFAVWSKAGGQDDLIWYTATRNSVGDYVANVPISNHRTAGTYYADVYATDASGVSSTCMGRTSFEVSNPTAGKIQITNKSAETGKFDVVVSGISAKSGISQVVVAIWSKSDQSDIYWYTATKQSNGTYKVQADIKKHDDNYGTYKVDVYATTGNGIQKCVCGTKVTMNQPAAIVKAVGNSTETKYTVTISNVASTVGTKSMSFAVWSVTGGQDDLKWYTAKNTSQGTWMAEITIADHRTAGNYCVDAYAVNGAGKSVFLGRGSFGVSNIPAAKVSSTNKNEGTGQFQVVIRDVSAKAGVSKVEVPVWSKSDQSDIYWYSAARQSDGTYMAQIDLEKHNYNYGTYKADVYVTAGNGIQKCVGTTKVTMNQPTAVIKAVGNSSETKYTATVSNAGLTGGIKSMSFAVWSAVGGQDDLRWYTGRNTSRGTWTTEIAIANHNTIGVYYVDAYAKKTSGGDVCLGRTTFQVSSASVKKISIANKNERTGRFDVIISGVSSRTGISKVDVPVWSKSDQSDIHWYTAKRQLDGSYIANVSVTNHGYNYGTYKADVYAMLGNDVYQRLGGSTTAMNAPKAQVTAKGNTEQTKYTLTASGVGIPGGVRSLSFAVWSAEGGQDDLIWYNAANTVPGTWTVDMKVVNHKTAGTYYVDVYAHSNVGTMAYLGGTTFKVSAPTASAVKLVNYNKAAGTFGVQVTGVQSVAGIANVKVAVWSAKDQSDLVWYDATPTSSGTYQIGADIRKHRNHTGRYYAHVYITDKNGICAYVGGVNCSM